MSKKRFICGLGFPINSDDPIRIISDSVENKDYYKFSDICNVLNEQQKEINELDQENADLLGDRIRSLEEFEKCTDKLKAKILELKGENEQLRKNFTDLVQWASEIAKRNVQLDEQIAKIQQGIKRAYEEKPYPTIEDIKKEINK